MQVQDLVTLVPWTLVAQILNLFIQAYLIKRFLFKPINEVLEKRRAKADAQIKEAEDARSEAQEMKERYEQDMAQAREKASEILTNAQRSADARSEEILREAGEAARSMREKAQADIEQEKKKAVNEIKNEIGSVAMEIAGKVIEREISEEDHRRLIDEFIENVGEAT